MDAACALRAEITAGHKQVAARDNIFTVEEFNAIGALAAERLAYKQQQEQEQQQRFEIEERQFAGEFIHPQLGKRRKTKRYRSPPRGLLLIWHGARRTYAQREQRQKKRPELRQSFVSQTAWMQ